MSRVPGKYIVAFNFYDAVLRCDGFLFYKFVVLITVMNELQ